MFLTPCESSAFLPCLPPPSSFLLLHPAAWGPSLRPKTLLEPCPLVPSPRRLGSKPPAADAFGTLSPRCVDFGLQRETALITREMAYFSLCAFCAAREPILGSIKSGLLAFVSCLSPFVVCLLPLPCCLLPFCLCLLPLSLAFCLLPFAFVSCLLASCLWLLPLAVCLLPRCLLPIAFRGVRVLRSLTCLGLLLGLGRLAGPKCFKVRRIVLQA